MRKQLSLRFKLTLIFLVVVSSLVGGLGYYQVHSINNLSTLFLNLIDRDLVRRDLLDQVKVTVVQAQNNILVYSNERQTHSVDATAAAKQLAALDDQFGGYYLRYQSILKQDTTHLGVQSTELKQSADQTFAAAHAYIVATAPTTAQLQQLQQLFTQLNQHTDQLVASEDAGIRTENADIDKSVASLIRTTLLLVGGSIVAVAVLAVVVASALTRSIRRLREGASRIANGDFSHPVPVKSDDELGQLATVFNEMSGRLSNSYQRLATETERDKTLLESLGEGVIAIDQDTNVTLVNQKALELFEMPPREKVVGLPVNHIYTLRDEQGHPITAADTPALQALQTTHPASGVFVFAKKDAAKILVMVSASPVVLSGKTIGAIMTLRDVTKEREVDRMKTEFISLASHQLRTPLSAIKWFTEMLVSGDAGELQPDQAEFARNIADSTERMIALVNALLNISRIESGRIMVDPKPTDLKELVSGIVNDLKGKTEEKQQTLIISVHDDLPKINLDPRLIGQVYLNLLTNAIKYTPKGGEVSVFISRKDDDIISQVTDNGYGIPKEQQARIFQKFFRATNAVKVETDGTGLGLYLIKAIIESSGGKIWFESAENKGTTFWFSIPVRGMQAKAGEVTLDA
ncbi:MAG TPA: ATP-binding protein [Candidatus Saccharimonadales bacterium]|nr:ATP-binding protein [Candidatus Saccharimonadales bacterium]